LEILSVSTNDEHTEPEPPRRFASTRWSLVALAGRDKSAEAQEALATLCQIYWYPIYAYARRRLPSVDDAQDMTQAFFAQLLEKDYLHAADPERGKFRSFLRAAFDHFMAKEWERAGAQKRGGSRPVLPLNFESGERRYCREPADYATPQSVFERRWALTILEQALGRLRGEFAEANKQELFNSLKGTLTGESDTEPYSSIAQRLDMSEQAVKVAVHRLRRRYGELVRAEIALTVASDDEIDEELRDLFQALRKVDSKQ
jgi:RNA polymerase sigma-70 factor (ECF subfamily)